MFSNKFVNRERITLVDNEKIITNDKVITIILHDFLSNIIEILNMPKKSYWLNNRVWDSQIRKLS